MKPAPFRYARAGSLAEATALLAEAPGDAKVLAGGQSLVPMLNMRLVRPAVLVDINGLRELTGITPTPEGGLRLGALTHHDGANRTSHRFDAGPDAASTGFSTEFSTAVVHNRDASGGT